MNTSRNFEDAQGWKHTIVELIRRTSTVLPDDVMMALKSAAGHTQESAQAGDILRTLQNNAALAQTASTPICQDTGTLTFWVTMPAGMDPNPLIADIQEGVAESTRCGYLRRNTIDTVSGTSCDSNVAIGAPVIHLQTSYSTDQVSIWLLLKGGGCENVSSQYSLPDTTLQAGRDLDGVRATLLHAVWRAQGLGCAPGILGVCIGGDRAEGYLHAKHQLLRPLTDKSSEPELAALERRVLTEANRLGIGPMGLGGRTTLLGVKITARSRIPASYFVTVAYSCWACRRRGLVASADGTLKGWLG